MSVAQPAAEYRLYLSGVVRFMLYLPVLLFGAVSIAFFALAIWGAARNPPPWFIGFIPLLVIVGIYSQLALIPYRIIWCENGAIDFVAWARTRSIRIDDLISIKPDASQVGFLRIKHRLGSFRLLPQFDGFHEFLTRLKAANPNIEMRGC